MRIIDRKWTDLALGYQAIQALQPRLESEFGRAVEVGYRQKYRRELNDWQKKRRIFFALIVLAPLSIIALCVTAYYYREVACVLAWWLVTVVVVFITLGVAGWSFIRQMVGGRPTPQRARVAASLGDRWWNSLSPKSLTIEKRSDRGEVDFLTTLDRLLTDEWLAVRDLFASSPALSESGILLLGPAGIWILEIRHWKGDIVKQDGTWKQVHGKRKETIQKQAPDDQWVRQRDEISETIRVHLPHLAWAASLLQGGVVFSHPRAKLDKTLILENNAPYGLAKAWLERLGQSPKDERLTLEARLEILDALINSAGRNEPSTVEYASSREEADKIYEAVAAELREHLANIVK